MDSTEMGNDSESSAFRDEGEEHGTDEREHGNNNNSRAENTEQTRTEHHLMRIDRTIVSGLQPALSSTPRLLSQRKANPKRSSTNTTSWDSEFRDEDDEGDGSDGLNVEEESANQIIHGPLHANGQSEYGYRNQEAPSQWPMNENESVLDDNYDENDVVLHVRNQEDVSALTTPTTGEKPPFLGGKQHNSTGRLRKTIKSRGRTSNMSPASRDVLEDAAHDSMLMAMMGTRQDDGYLRREATQAVPQSHHSTQRRQQRQLQLNGGDDDDNDDNNADPIQVVSMETTPNEEAAVVPYKAAFEENQRRQRQKYRRRKNIRLCLLFSLFVAVVTAGVVVWFFQQNNNETNDTSSSSSGVNSTIDDTSDDNQNGGSGSDTGTDSGTSTPSPSITAPSAAPTSLQPTHTPRVFPPSLAFIADCQQYHLLNSRWASQGPDLDEYTDPDTLESNYQQLMSMLNIPNSTITPVCTPQQISLIRLAVNLSSTATIMPTANLSAMDDDDRDMLEIHYVLGVLFLSLDGFRWLDRTNWMSMSISVCEWPGIACASTGDGTVRVVGLDLSNQDMYGWIPHDIHRLRDLGTSCVSFRESRRRIGNIVSKLVSIVF